MSLRKAIHDAAVAAPTADPKKLAADLMSRAKRAEFLALLAAEIAVEQRHVTLSAEKEAFAALFRKDAEPLVPPSVTFSALASEVFALGDGIRVSWTEATVEQHAQRIAFLKKMRDGISQTIGRHEEAIRLITEHGASCLADLDAEAAA